MSRLGLLKLMGFTVSRSFFFPELLLISSSIVICSNLQSPYTLQRKLRALDGPT